MTVLILITSAVKILENKKGFDYCKLRSVFTTKERYEQTLYTITSAKNKFPNCKIIIIENSPFKWKTIPKDDYVYQNSPSVQKQNGRKQKGMLEGGSCIEFLESQYFKKFMEKNKNITEIHKISGRYYFDEKFSNPFVSGKITFFRIGYFFPVLTPLLRDWRFIYNNNNLNTCYYNLDPKLLKEYIQIIKKAYDIVNAKSLGYEVAVAKSIKLIDKNKVNKINRKVGIRGIGAGFSNKKEIYV